MKKIKLIDGAAITFKKLTVLDLQGTPYVITLLRERRLNPEAVPEEFLSLTDNSGTSVLDICIEQLRELISVYPRALSRARALAIDPRIEYGKWKQRKCLLPLHFRKIKEVILISDSLAGSVAHELAKKGLLPVEMMTPDILQFGSSTQNTLGMSVLETLIIHRQLTPEILSLPWDKNIFLFELLQDTKFRNQLLSENLRYVDTQLYLFRKNAIKEQIIFNSINNDIDR